MIAPATGKIGPRLSALSTLTGETGFPRAVEAALGMEIDVFEAGPVLSEKARPRLVEPRCHPL
jgi:hypothetical protein